MSRGTNRSYILRFLDSLFSEIAAFNPYLIFPKGLQKEPHLLSTDGNCTSDNLAFKFSVNDANEDRGRCSRARQLGYVREELEKLNLLLKNIELTAEPDVLEAGVEQIINSIARIEAAIRPAVDFKKILNDDGIFETFTATEKNSSTFHAGNVSAVEGEEMFLVQLKKTIVSNIAATDLDVDRLSDLMNMSRRNLFRRIKSSAGLTPAELINEIRLRIARELLLAGTLKMYEIAERVGFKSRIVFTRNFTRLYGVSPSEFVKKQPHRH